MPNIAEQSTRLGKTVIFSLWVWLASEAAGAISALLTIHAQGGFIGAAADARQRAFATKTGEAVAGINLLVYLVTAVLVLRWIHAVTRNARSVSDQMIVTPGWAVGRFFLPILNLWKPFQGLAETWRASVEPAAPDTVPTPVILRWWWGLWLATSLFGHFSGRLVLKAHTPTALIDAGWAMIALFLLNVPLAVILVRIVTQLSAIQHALLTRAAPAIDEGPCAVSVSPFPC